MDGETKKEVWKVINVAVFISMSIFLILPYLVQMSTYLHELAHQKALTKYNVENAYQLNLIETIPNFFNPKSGKLGVTKFSVSQYEELDTYEKAEVNLAGIVSDLKLLFLVSIYLSFANIYLFYKIKFGKPIKIGWVLAINWILFMWLLALIQITLANITYPSGDVYQLVRFLAS